MHRRGWPGFQNVEEAGESEGIDRASGRIATRKSLNQSRFQSSTTCAPTLKPISTPGPSPLFFWKGSRVPGPLIISRREWSIGINGRLQSEPITRKYFGIDDEVPRYLSGFGECPLNVSCFADGTYRLITRQNGALASPWREECSRRVFGEMPLQLEDWRPRDHSSRDESVETESRFSLGKDGGTGSPCPIQGSFVRELPVWQAEGVIRWL
ncbi:uncharacterized protein N7498_004766 [Penicillium cinerascens]|uniref:Uncharacterized protein n=1 Tax=Penicillium cinerascens TaxID=70096 RepID=A0A9W9MMH4_9EURO|nr:uncharacterized protein N7498_004766 [Penicillium cinerascens]KAJ5203887.1 hypothetical protein N7498_004766 [Penicillium cinerascens]